MNSCNFTGELVEDPARDDGPGPSRAQFTLAVEGRRAGGHCEIEYADFEAYDTGADVILREFRKGDRIEVECTYRRRNGRVRFRVNRFSPPLGGRR